MSDHEIANDEEIFVMQQNQISEALHRSRTALYTPSDATECVDCGDEIPAARKLAIPSAVRCTPCEEHHDRQLKNI